jgi:RHS repeat-associated protein
MTAKWNRQGMHFVIIILMVLATASFASFTQKNAFDKSATSSSSPQSSPFPQSQPLILTSSFTSPQSQPIVATNDLYTRACEYAEEPANSFSIPHYSLDLRAWVYDHKLVLLEQKKAYLRYLNKCFAGKRSGTESHLGSTMAVINADGTPTVKEATWYHPFGTMETIAEQTTPVRTKFTGKEFDGGETPYCEFEFDLAITNFDAGRHYYGQLFVTYQDIATSIQYDKVYNFDFDQSQQKFTLKANEQFTTRTTISRLRIATSGASGGIYNDIARSYPIDVGDGKKLAFSVDGSVLQNNPGVPQYQVTTYTITDIKRGSDLFYFGARYYDAELGSFTSTDPMDEFWNAYSYCGGDPINLWDPNGMESEDKDNESTELTGSESMELAGSEFFETKEHDNYFLTIYGDPNGPTEAPKANVSHYENKPQTQGDALNKREYSPSYEQIESHRYSPSKILAHYSQDTGPGLSKSTETIAPFILSSRDKKNIEMGVNVATVFIPGALGVKATKGGMDIALGLQTSLRSLTRKTGSTSYFGWTKNGLSKANPFNEKQFVDAFNQATTNARTINFSLDGFNLKNAFSMGGKGPFGAPKNVTNWEFLQVLRSPKTVFWQNGKVVPLEQVLARVGLK